MFDPEPKIKQPAVGMEPQKSCVGRKACETQKTRGHGRPARVDTDFLLQWRHHFLWGDIRMFELATRCANAPAFLPIRVDR